MKKGTRSIVALIIALCFMLCCAMGVSAADKKGGLTAAPGHSENGVALSAVPSAGTGPMLVFKGDGKLYVRQDGEENEYTENKDKWSADGNTLTLKGFSFTTEAYTALQCAADTKLVLEGENAITSTYSGVYYTSGLDCYGSLTISGTGELTLKSGTSTGEYGSIGLYCDGELSVNGDAAITGIGGEAELTSCGVEAMGLTVNDDAVVNGLSTNDGDNCGIGIYRKEVPKDSGVYTGGILTVNGGTVTGIGVNAATDNVWGISVDDDIIVNGGTVSAVAGDAAKGFSNAISAWNDGEITINGGRVFAQAGDTGNGDSVGISTQNGDIQINRGVVYATTGDSVFEAADISKSGGSFSLYSEKGDFDIYGGKIVATALSATRYSIGVGLDGGSMNVYGGELRAYGGVSEDSRLSESDYESSGAYTEGDLIVDGGTVIAVATMAPYSFAVMSATLIDVISGVLKASSGEATEEASALYVESTAKTRICVDEPLKITIGPDYTAPGAVADDTVNNTSVISAGAAGEIAKDVRIGIDMPFTDINKKAYYDTPLLWANGNGIISGETKTTFAPSTTITREMLMAMLYRLAGKPDVSGTNFPDVAETSYAYKAILWAKNEGIAAGIDGKFYGGEPVTREQTASFIYRYADKIAKLDMSATAPLSDFGDSADVHNYAKTPIGWCVAMEILSGSDGNILPQHSATRAEVTAMVYRLNLQIPALI